MTKLITFAFIGLMVLGGSGVAHAQTKMTKNFWVYTGTKFRRGGAEEALLGSIGVVRKTFGKAFDYERKAILTRDLLVGREPDLKIVRTVRVRGSSINDFSKDSVFKYLTFNVSDTISQLRKGELDLVKFEIASESAFIDAINRSPKYLSRMKAQPKNKLRVITAVWIVVDAHEWADFRGSVSGNLSLYGATVDGDHAASTSQDWEIKPGTVFAFEFSKVNWNKGRTKVESLKTDRANM